jgi:hypothetical protein
MAAIRKRTFERRKTINLEGPHDPLYWAAVFNTPPSGVRDFVVQYGKLVANIVPRSPKLDVGLPTGFRK